ncbi:MAG: type II toxin-antitoxin system PemK/MazF family toxin [Burkholderiales bacterium]|nr:type II toxin-antitoxin system PemK/MazF family toxin [Burkholderiales bacterium]
MSRVPLVLRGEVYTARLDPTEGSEMRKTRPVVIVSNDIDNRHSPCVLVAPLTEHGGGKVYPTEVLVLPPVAGVLKPSRISCTQVRVLDKRRLMDANGNPLCRWGQLPPEVVLQVDAGLRIALALD